MAPAAMGGRAPCIGYLTREGGRNHQERCPAIPAFDHGRPRILALDGPPTVWIGSPAARSSGGCGLASPTVPGTASLLAACMVTRSIVIVATMATGRAIALKTRVIRFWSSIVRPPRNGSVARG